MTTVQQSANISKRIVYFQKEHAYAGYTAGTGYFGRWKREEGIPCKPDVDLAFLRQGSLPNRAPP
jgi:hypothetical protein